ncbi:hypothetical protein NL108_001301 [Boleophthalmus pectinirostris]|uniref:angiogenin n=1 Tax=Boleophthalmus pectinirostris TaxID=150288 RepID=UPI000A1C2663|nr:angiogenin [Boleophthalmus pectinirostris]KAJ0066068.1 hypothetical protein NL108_001301 [Boleophthalmus pectinirostris]
MSALWVYLPLVACLLLGQQTCAKNEAPCQLSKWNNGYRTFLKRHIRDGTPQSLDQNEWEKYIRNNGGCDRPTQSFLSPKDLDRVKAVCSAKGGKVYKENLCISQEPFTFVTVRSESGTCGIRSVRQEKKHLILACEVLDNLCVPVHFEGNPTDRRPSNNDPSCQDPQTRGHAPVCRASALWLGSVFLLLLLL